MVLTSFSESALHQLLADHFHGLNLVGSSNPTAPTYSHESLSRILGQLASDDYAETKTIQLETLSRLYRSLSTGRNRPSPHLVAIKQRILELLGLAGAGASPAALPTVVREESVRLFNFFQEGKICQGSHYSGELFALAQEFPAGSTLQAYRLALALADQGVACLFTSSACRDGVWVSLRSPACLSLIKNEPLMLESILALHLNACKLKHEAGESKPTAIDHV
jgi:hypothetical protein